MLSLRRFTILCFLCVISVLSLVFFFFFFNDTATTEIYTLSLHTLFRSPLQPLPVRQVTSRYAQASAKVAGTRRSEEHTSELQSRFDLVCRLLLEKKKNHHPLNEPLALTDSILTPGAIPRLNRSGAWGLG